MIVGCVYVCIYFEQRYSPADYIGYAVCARQGAASAIAKVSVCSLESEQLTIRLPLALGLPLKIKENHSKIPDKKTPNRPLIPDRELMVKRANDDETINSRQGINSRACHCSTRALNPSKEKCNDDWRGTSGHVHLNTPPYRWPALRLSGDTKCTQREQTANRALMAGCYVSQQNCSYPTWLQQHVVAAAASSGSNSK